MTPPTEQTLSQAPRLTLAVASMAARLDRLSLAGLPVIPGVIWQIFVQGDRAAIAAHAPRLARADVTLTPIEGLGVARSRNAALAAAKTDLLLFADDDLTFHPAAITALIAQFDACPQADFLCARLADETGRPRKRYGRAGARMRWFNCGTVGTPELALRPARMRAAGVTFDPAFGAGAPDFLGDEFIFLCDALRAGLRGWHVALTLASHPAASSGLAQGAAVMAVRRRVFIRALGRWASLPVRLVFLLRQAMRGGGGLGALGGWRGALAFLRP